MATVYKDQEEDADIADPTMTMGGQSSQITAGAAPAASSGSAKGGSGSFTNIKDYVAANKPKTAQMSEGITGQVRKEGEGLKTDIEKQRESYLGQEGKFGQGQKDFISNQITNAGVGPDPQTAEDITKFRGLATGATQAADLTKQRQSASDLERRGKEFQTSKGRFEGLQNLVGGQTATYGKGQRQLDQLLLAGDKASRIKGIKDVRGATQGLGENVGNLESDIRNARALRMQEAGGAETARSGMVSSAQEQVDLYNQQRKELLDFQQGRSTDVSQATADRFGLTAGENSYGLKEDVKGLSSDRTTSEMFDVDQFNRLNALAKLSGRSQGTSAGSLDASQNYESMDDLRSRLMAGSEEAKGLYGTQQGYYDQGLAKMAEGDASNVALGGLAGSIWSRNRDKATLSNWGNTLRNKIGLGQISTGLNYGALLGDKTHGQLNNMTYSGVQKYLNESLANRGAQYGRSGPVTIRPDEPSE